MRNRLYIISGAKGTERDQKSLKPVRLRRHGDEPNLDILKESPCLRCELFVQSKVCPHVVGCSKIDQFQQVAAGHCTLYKDHDVFSILKI
ncbi:MAG: hypothetical protein JRJ42_10530 [Deltaproteobacteria bacterium]|nr:hypothetical protein [Deltaproteobacteria bacterium]MBW2021056.1 hypothetical protein [Deltaproteobacteria bacterium]RLB80940.1 MAG: hypothetical protein DRH17_10610 [Deltaproteobacteria bacterium]